MSKKIFVFLCLILSFLMGCSSEPYTDDLNTQATTIEATSSQTPTISIFVPSPGYKEPTIQTEPSVSTEPPASTEPTEPIQVTTQPTEPTVLTEPTEPTEPKKPEHTKEDYTLRDSFGFYQGEYPMELITSIVFSREKPTFYDEYWSASKTGASCLRGYRIGEQVIIVGEHIYASDYCSYMFAGYNTYGDKLWSSLIAIDGLSLLDTSCVTSMKMMFAYTRLRELKGIEYWDVSNVTDFTAMFQGNDNSGDVPLTYLPVGAWDTSSATSMKYMFYGCAQLTYIPVDNWDVSNVTNFSHMFADCYNLTSLNLTNWQTSSARNFDAFLNDCRSLTTIDVSLLDTSKCTQFSQMFESCYSLQEIVGINNWDVSNASYYAFSETFHCCYNLESLDLSNWEAAPDNTARMFKNCKNLSYLDISGLDLSNAATIEMYDGCENLKFS